MNILKISLFVLVSVGIMPAAIDAAAPSGLAGRRSQLDIPTLSLSNKSSKNTSVQFCYIDPLIISYDMAIDMIQRVVGSLWSCGEWDFADDIHGKLNRCNRYLWWIKHALKNVKIDHFPVEVLCSIFEAEKKKLLAELFDKATHEKADFVSAVLDLDNTHGLDGMFFRGEM